MEQILKKPPVAELVMKFQVFSGIIGFVVDKMALGQLFSEHFGFLCQLLHISLIILSSPLYSFGFGFESSATGCASTVYSVF